MNDLATASTAEIELELLLRAQGKRQRAINHAEITLMRLREKQAASERELAALRIRIAKEKGLLQ